jgi:hypothetical protein
MMEMKERIQTKLVDLFDLYRPLSPEIDVDQFRFHKPILSIFALKFLWVGKIIYFLGKMNSAFGGKA